MKGLTLTISSIGAKVRFDQKCKGLAIKISYVETKKPVLIEIWNCEARSSEDFLARARNQKRVFSISGFARATQASLKRTFIPVIISEVAILKFIYFRILAPTTYIFFASALPVIVFGEQLNRETDGSLSIVDTLASTDVCGIIHSIFTRIAGELFGTLIAVLFMQEAIKDGNEVSLQTMGFLSLQEFPGGSFGPLPWESASLLHWTGRFLLSPYEESTYHLLVSIMF
ncbi:hypothetical protein HYC85_025899 [Camellia sinensis]|uniref:Bicarbonate transporter-like transmembrane domain-containing protein n=1 Tax=Camellia sinensis TaxID=4442 RepID=A0A7J7G220_CAMSI|nr:hypothetical protein HYC85_025899 [Camellia sinensis]